MFPIPEIIYDPTLVLSPHVFLLRMLFKAQAFKSPSIDSTERLYGLDAPDNPNEQTSLLKEDPDNDPPPARLSRKHAAFASLTTYS